MITMYWALEYASVLCGYVFLMFIWPSVVFRNHLANKSKAYWFCFCVTVQIVLVNIVVLTFGLVHILNRWTVFAFFFGILLLIVLRKVDFTIEKIETFRHLVVGAYGVKWLFLQIVRFAWKWLKKQCLKIWKMVYPHLGEYLLLAVLVIFAMIYFSYGLFQHYSYGFSDGYVHHSWIYGLMQGTIFSGGIYPEGMHCFIYCLYALFGIHVYSSLLFLGGIHVVVLLVCVYCLLREIFHWRYTPFFVLAAFLTIDSVSNSAIYSMSRLQCSLPQEFGLFTPFVCALFLIRYLKNAACVTYKGKTSRFYWDENLMIFAMAFTASIVTHFYTTIMAFLLCISFVVFFIRRVFYYKRLVPLVIAVLCGLAVAVFPMVGAYASGIPFHSAIGWALGVMHDTTPEAIESSQQTETLLKEDNGSMIDAVTGRLRQVYENNYQVVYGATRGKWIATLTGFAVGLWLTVRLVMVLLRRYSKIKVGKNYFHEYLPMILAAFLFMVAYAAPTGLPQLVEGSRLCSVEQILNLTAIMMPVDMLFSLLALCCRKQILQVISIFCTVEIYIATMALGVYHGYLSFGLSQYNSEVMVTNSITQTFPKDSYTIVSPTEQLYMTIEYGRHEDLLTFVEKSGDRMEYTLPTKYVFLYIEKKPIYYSQAHFFKGPSWLAEEKYPELLPMGNVSQCPEILNANISESAAQQELTYENPWDDVYIDLENRTILESKAYDWCERFSKIYPWTLDIYYEDDDFICYYFKQEINALYNLAIE